MTDGFLPKIDINAGLPAALAKWDEDWRMAWAERAAILEYDAVMPREKAEMKAYWQTRKLRKPWVRGAPPSSRLVLEVVIFARR